MSDEPREGAKRLRCLLGAHRWTTKVNAGARWQECTLCGKCKKQAAMANRFPPGGFGDGAGGGGM